MVPVRLISGSRLEWKPRTGGCKFTSPVQSIWCRAWFDARDERRLTALQQRYQKVALLIGDELGFRAFRARRR
jgi:hypothetical protein